MFLSVQVPKISRHPVFVSGKRGDCWSKPVVFHNLASPIVENKCEFLWRCSELIRSDGWIDRPSHGLNRKRVGWQKGSFPMRLLGQYTSALAASKLLFFQFRAKGVACVCSLVMPILFCIPRKNCAAKKDSGDPERKVEPTLSCCLLYLMRSEGDCLILDCIAPLGIRAAEDPLFACLVLRMQWKPLDLNACLQRAGKMFLIGSMGAWKLSDIYNWKKDAA